MFSRGSKGLGGWIGIPGEFPFFGLGWLGGMAGWGCVGYVGAAGAMGGKGRVSITKMSPPFTSKREGPENDKKDPL